MNNNLESLIIEEDFEFLKNKLNENKITSKINNNTFECFCPYGIAENDFKNKIFWIFDRQIYSVYSYKLKTIIDLRKEKLKSIL